MIINKRSPDFEFASVLKRIYQDRKRNNSNTKHFDNKRGLKVNECPITKIKVNVKTPIHSTNSSFISGNQSFYPKHSRKQSSSLCDIRKSNSSTKSKDVRNISVDLNARRPQSVSSIMKPDELIMINERWLDIIRELNKENINDNYNALNHACFEWWLFLFNSTLLGAFKAVFDSTNKRIINSACNIEIYYVMLLYDITLKPQMFRGLKIIFKSVFHALKMNFNVMLSRTINSYNNVLNENDVIYIEQLKRIIKTTNNNKVMKHNYVDLASISEQAAIDLIKQNCSLVTDYFKIILMQYQTHYMKDKKTGYIASLVELFNNLTVITHSKLNDFFFRNIATTLNLNRSLVNPSLIRKYNNPTIPAPYIIQPTFKRYTLVLDLDETLICFKFKSKNENSGTLYFRPHLFQFLQSMKTFYELIVFTAATKEYAEPIIRAIECKEQIFDYKFYREHAVVVGKDFVKDLSRIGRSLSRVVIVDNMPMNFRLHEDNGIAIIPYFYQDKEDNALLQLGNILRNIAMERGDDIREHLVKYQQEITLKVSTNSNSYI